MSLRRIASPVFAALTLGIVLTGCGGSGGGGGVQNPGPVATTTTLAVSPTANVTTSTPVTLTATVSSTGSGTPTGSVTFLDGTATVGTATLTSGTASVMFSTLTSGSHSFTAKYVGSAGFSTSSSSASSLTVSAPLTATTTTLSVVPTTNVTTTTPVTLTASVTSTGGTPTGTLTFFDGTTPLGGDSVSAGSQSFTATLTLSTLTAGSHSFTASYAGDTSYAASTSAAASLTVTSAPASTTLTLAITPNTNVTDATPVTLTASITSSGGTPTGTITFLDGAATVGTATLNGSGTATLPPTSLTAGSHSLTASYAGDSSYTASTSSAVALTVTSSKTATTTALSVSPTTSVTDTTPLTLTATVTSSSGTPTGSVTFLDGTTSLGTGTLSAGAASLAVTSLAAGSHSLTASYAGSGSYAASTSSAFALTVTSSLVINAHATFSFTTANQTISGFGAAEAFYVNYLDNLPSASQTAIYTALFDPVQGLGLNYLRVQDLYRNGSADTDTPQVVTGANAAHGSPLTIIMSSWSPTADLKSNGTTTGGGTLAQVSGAYNYAGFAQYWYNSLTAYAALGVSPDYISIQNEPDFNASYDSCLFSATEGPYASYGKAFDAVYNSINGGSLAKVPKMIGPETLSAGSSFLSLAGSVSSTEIAAYAHHLYNVSSTNPNPDSGLTTLQGVETAYPTQTKFMTEYYDAPGFLTAWNIHNAFTAADDNAYIFWGATWPSALDSAKDQAQDQQGLLYIDNPFASQSTWAFKQGWTYNDAYYAMKHYSYYIKPGYIRYNATVDNTDERVSVYQSPDQKTTIIVALNVSTTATDVLALDLSSITYTTSALYRSTFSQPITTGERWASLGAYDSTNGITLAPQSAVTIVLTN